MDSIYQIIQLLVGGVVIAGLFFFAIEQLRKATNSLHLYFFPKKYELSEANRDMIHKRVRGETMVERAKAVGPVVVVNQQNGMMAVTSWTSFRLELMETHKKWIKLVDEKKWVEAMEPRQVLPSETFIFVDNHLQNRIYTGTISGAKHILDSIVYQVTGVMRSEVDAKSFEMATKCLIENDKRLAIPFLDASVRKDEDRLEEAVKRFGFRDANDVIFAILDKVKK